MAPMNPPGRCRPGWRSARRPASARPCARARTCRYRSCPGSARSWAGPGSAGRPSVNATSAPPDTGGMVVRTRCPAESMPFASALSEHPVAAQATGEVAGAVLEALGDRPDLVVVSRHPPHAGALEDIVATIDAVLHPLAMIGCAAESVVGRGREVEETPAISLWAGRVGPLLPVTLHRRPPGRRHLALRGWPEDRRLRADGPAPRRRPLHLPHRRVPGLDGRSAPGLPVIGGNASAARGPGGSRLVVGDRIVAEGRPGCSSDAGVDIETVVSQGCRAYGRLLTVTRVGPQHHLRGGRQAGHGVHGRPDQGRPRPLADIGRPRGNGLHRRAARRRTSSTEPGPGDFLVRNVVGVDRATGAVAVDDRVPLGSTVQFHLRDAETADDDLRAAPGAPARPTARSMFTCNGRGTRLFDEARPRCRRRLRTGAGRCPVGGLLRRRRDRAGRRAATSSTASPPRSPCSGPVTADDRALPAGARTCRFAAASGR